MSDESTVKAASASGWLDDCIAGITAYYLTSLPVMLGVWFGVSFLNRDGPGGDPIAACVRWDALHYIDIIRDGYSYDPTRRSLVAQFPAYPLAARGVCEATGLSPEEGALLTANLFLMGAFVLLVRWVRVRWPDATADQRMLVLAVFGLWPIGLLFRMPYAESLFLCGTLAVLYGMARRWPLIVLALLTGFVTATRPVGVAVTAAFVWHVLTQPGSRLWVKAGCAAASAVPRSPDRATQTTAGLPEPEEGDLRSGRVAGSGDPATAREAATGRWSIKVARVILLTPLACWGLLAFMLYQERAFGTPWAFVQTQQHWTFAAPEDRSWEAKAVSLLTLEPIWGVYDPSSPRYWEYVQARGGELFSVIFWNPILFLLAAALLALGWWKGWLTVSELILGTCLLAIPYLTRAYEMSMASHGRFAAIVVVNYLVIGRIFAAAGTPLRISLCAGLATLLCLFTALYAANYLVF